MTDPLQALDVPAGKRFHLIGIGGVGMAGLARILAARGGLVQGSDLLAGLQTGQLQKEGVTVYSGHSRAHLSPDTDLCIHSTAIPDDQEELLAARSSGIPCIQRGKAFARLASIPGSIAVSGTHGKSSTTAMIRHMLQAVQGREPDYFIGAEGPEGEFLTSWNGRPPFVYEADESDGTLIHYHPDCGVITNIDYDHMEHHASESDFIDMFRQFAGQVRDMLVVPHEDPPVALVGRLSARVVTFGFDEGCTLQAVDPVYKPDQASFAVRLDGQSLGTVTLQTPGRHMVLNALAAIGGIWAVCGEVPETGLNSLSTYRHLARRMECLWNSGGVEVISDYAHHPAELSAVLDILQPLCKQDLHVIFQPHRYTRTRALLHDFVRVLRRVPGDLTLCPVYAASEIPVKGGTIEDLAKALRAQNVPIYGILEPEKAVEAMIQRAKTGDLIAVLGAGDIDPAARRVLRGMDGSC